MVEQAIFRCLYKIHNHAQGSQQNQEVCTNSGDKLRSPSYMLTSSQSLYKYILYKYRFKNVFLLLENKYLARGKNAPL